MDKKSISLYEFNQSLKLSINAEFSDFYWISAEISELKSNYSGHAYLELIEKEEGSNNIKARMRATIWANKYRSVKAYFETQTGKKLEQGLKVLIRARVDFHEAYGVSLNIIDIDPSYTLGDLEKRKQEVIRKLTEEGVIDMNQSLELPDLIRNIAVISSETAAGYQDFINQLQHNENEIPFNCVLFPAIMQGNNAEESIIMAFDQVYEQEEHFDLVVLIRGGGASIDLTCFDQYWLAHNIAQFPLPVLTGIGHDKDQSVADLVAHTTLKTPTAVAEFILQHMEQHLFHLQYLEDKFQQLISERLTEEKHRLKNLSNQLQLKVKDVIHTQDLKLNYFLSRTNTCSREVIIKKRALLEKLSKQTQSSHQQVIHKSEQKLSNYVFQLKSCLKNRLIQEKNKLEHAELTNKLMDPIHVLKRGYSITTQNGKLLKSSKDLKPGDTIKTTVYEGEFESVISTKGDKS